MINRLIFLFLLFSIVEASANIKEKIIQNLETTNNLTFNFEQNVNGKTENGHCALSYPQKIFCKYNLKNNKILVSNGKSIVIKTNSSYYLYPLKRTPLNLILNKNNINITCPVHLIHGLNDTDINSDFSIQLAKKLTSTNATLKLITSSDHTLSSNSDLKIINQSISEIISI